MIRDSIQMDRTDCLIPFLTSILGVTKIALSLSSELNDSDFS